MALTEDRNTLWRADEYYQRSLAGGVQVFNGSIVCGNNNGYAVPGSADSSLVALGVADEYADNRNGADGDKQLNIHKDCFCLNNSEGVDEITLADSESTCYIVDDETVAKTDGGGARPVAGVIRDVDDDGVWVKF